MRSYSVGALLADAWGAGRDQHGQDEQQEATGRHGADNEHLASFAVGLAIDLKLFKNWLFLSMTPHLHLDNFDLLAGDLGLDFLVNLISEDIGRIAQHVQEGLG